MAATVAAATVADREGITAVAVTQAAAILPQAAVAAAITASSNRESRGGVGMLPMPPQSVSEGAQYAGFAWRGFLWPRGEIANLKRKDPTPETEVWETH